MNPKNEIYITSNFPQPILKLEDAEQQKHFKSSRI